MHSRRLLTIVIPAILTLLVACAPQPTEPPAAETTAAPSETPKVELPENAKPLSEIVAAVRSQGYDPVVEIEFDDGEWEIDAYKGDERIELFVDPVSGETRSHRPEAGGKPLDEILKAVESQGYGPIPEVELDDDGWEIEAVNSGQTVELLANPETGEIRLAEEEKEESEPTSQ